jgi:hypothetical protein
MNFACLLPNYLIQLLDCMHLPRSSFFPLDTDFYQLQSIEKSARELRGILAFFTCDRISRFQSSKPNVASATNPICVTASPKRSCIHDEERDCKQNNKVREQKNERNIKENKVFIETNYLSRSAPVGIRPQTSSMLHAQSEPTSDCVSLNRKKHFIYKIKLS